MLDLRQYELRYSSLGPVALFCCLGIILPFFSISSTFTPLEEKFGAIEMDQNEWHIYVVDRGTLSSIDVDSASLPHMGYYTGGEKGLGYAEWKDGSWTTSAIDNKSGAGNPHSMVLDRFDRPFVAYRNSHLDSNRSAIMMAFRNGMNWTFHKVEDNPLASPDLSIALDSSDLPGISYMKRQFVGDESALWFAKLESNGTWSYEEIDSNGELRYSSLCMDSKDNFHISYEELGDELRYAYWNGTEWSVEVVEDEGVGAWSSIIADKHGRPHIAYYDGTHSDVKYATKLNGTWNMTSIDYMIGPILSLDLDSLERPHISYQSRDLHLKHAYWNGTAWNIEVVDNTTYVGELSSMKIDNNDDIHISYREYNDPMNHHVRYATTKELPTGGIETSVDIDPDTLNLGSKGRFVTAYIELEGADVRHIDASTIRLNDIVSPVLDERYGFVTSEDSYIVDHDGDGMPERMVKFWRSEVQEVLDVGLIVTITVSGTLVDGAPFEGTDEIRVIDSSKLNQPNPAMTGSGYSELLLKPDTYGMQNREEVRFPPKDLDTSKIESARIA
jgi:hypothetical protein